MPRMPFNGVRNSWLTVARKRDLASLAASALTRASSSARSDTTRSVTSRPTRKTSDAPSGSVMVVSVQAIQRTPPSVSIASSTNRTPSARMWTGPASTILGRASVPSSAPPETSSGRRGSAAGGRLGHRSGHQSFLQSMPRDLIERAVAHHTDLAWVKLYVGRWLRTPVEHPDGTRVERTKGQHPQGGAAVVLPDCPHQEVVADIVKRRRRLMPPSTTRRLGFDRDRGH